MECTCDVMVDYLNQSRKPIRAKKADVFLERDAFRNITLVIGKQKNKRQTFKLEDVTRIYPPNPKADPPVLNKVTLEITLAGGTICNVLLQNVTPETEVKNLMDICKQVLTDPYGADGINLHVGGGGEDDDDDDDGVEEAEEVVEKNKKK